MMNCRHKRLVDAKLCSGANFCWSAGLVHTNSTHKMLSLPGLGFWDYPKVSMSPPAVRERPVPPLLKAAQRTESESPTSAYWKRLAVWAKKQYSPESFRWIAVALPSSKCLLEGLE